MCSLGQSSLEDLFTLEQFISRNHLPTSYYWIRIEKSSSCRPKCQCVLSLPSCSTFDRSTSPHLLPLRTSGGPVTSKLFLSFIRGENSTWTFLGTRNSVLQGAPHPVGQGDKWLLLGEWPGSLFHLSYCSGPSCGEEEEKEGNSCDLGTLHFSQRQPTAYQQLLAMLPNSMQIPLKLSNNLELAGRVGCLSRAAEG